MNDYSQPANNSLRLTEEGIIELTQRGFQTAESVSQYKPQVDELTAKMHEEGKKALILVDMSGITGHDPEARNAGLKTMRGDYDALAIFGSDLSVQMVVNWLIAAFGGNRVQFFSDRAEALDWLHKK